MKENMFHDGHLGDRNFDQLPHAYGVSHNECLQNGLGLRGLGFRV